MQAMKRTAILPRNEADAGLHPSTARGVDYLPAVLLALTGLGGLSFAWMTAGTDSGQYLVIAAPGSSLADTVNLVRAADGGLVGKGRFANIVIAGSVRADFPAAVRRAGAWLAVAAPAPGGCIAPLLREQSL